MSRPQPGNPSLDLHVVDDFVFFGGPFEPIGPAVPLGSESETRQKARRGHSGNGTILRVPIIGVIVF